jgi:hypothetical protein
MDDGRTKRLIARAASKRGLTTSEYVRLAIHRKLWQDATAESRRVGVRRARSNVCSPTKTFSA